MPQSSEEIIRIKASVRARDGMCCTQCGLTNDQHKEKTGKQLDVHRVVPGSIYSVEPGVCATLCRTCHGPKPRRPHGQGDTHRALIPDDLYEALAALGERNDRPWYWEMNLAIRSHFRKHGINLPDDAFVPACFRPRKKTSSP